VTRSRPCMASPPMPVHFLNRNNLQQRDRQQRSALWAGHAAMLALLKEGWRIGFDQPQRHFKVP
jgi:hypothetical protein